MNPRARAFGLIVTVACVALWARDRASNDFAGVWNVSVQLPGGTTSTVLTLRQVDKRIEGSSGPVDEQGVLSLHYNGLFNKRDDLLTLRVEATPLVVAIFPRRVGKLTLHLENGALQGTGVLYNVPVRLMGNRPGTDTSPPKTYHYTPSRYFTTFSGTNPPALYIHPGDSVVTTTVDAGGQDARGQWATMPGNPQTGPFFVVGAMPGDTLVVHLDRLRLDRPRAEMACWGLAANALLPGDSPNSIETCPLHWSLDIEHAVGRLEVPSSRLRSLTVALHPMIGTIGVAPPASQSIAASDLGSYGGNLDYNRITEGTTVYLPVFQAGALLSLGDAHALQGDGEVTGQGLETSLSVEFTVNVIKGKSLGMPWAEDAQSVMVSGIGGSLNDALQAATSGMSEWLRERYHLDQAEVAVILGTSLTYDIAEIVDPHVHVVARLRKDIFTQLSGP
jgi:amidase